jgi:hypothetical protein
VRFAVGEPAPYRRPDAGGYPRVHHVEIQRDVNPLEVRESPEGAAHDARDPVGVHLLHRVDADPGLLEQQAFLQIHGPQAHDHHVFGVYARALAADGHQVGVAATREHGERHAVDVPRRRGLGGVEVGVGVEPDEAGAPRVLRDAGDGAYGDGVVAAEEDGEVTLGGHCLGPPGDLLADIPDGSQVLYLPFFLYGLGERGRGVTEVLYPVAELLERRLQPGVADGGGPHVHPAAVLAEVHRHPEDPGRPPCALKQTRHPQSAAGRRRPRRAPGGYA